MPIDYSRPASDSFDSVQVEMLIKEEQRLKQQQRNLKQYLEKFIIYSLKKSMTLYDFIALDEQEQAEAVWNGVFIADRQDQEHRICCTR